MIAASLLAIAIVSFLLQSYQGRLHAEKTRVQGVALTRALSGADYSQLVPSPDRPAPDKGSLLRQWIDVQGTSNFAYGLVVNPAGAKLYETTSPGSIAPAATMPTEPYAWFGEHTLTSPGDNRQIREFYAPIMQNGLLAGFVRVGYYSKTAGISTDELSSFATIALPIFLLTVMSYLLIRREIKPLGQLSQKLEQASQAYGAPASGIGQGDFIQRFDQFMQLVQSRVNQLDQSAASTQAGTHLITYRQEKAESALNAIPDAVLVLDEAGVATYVNQKFENLIGTPREQVIGQTAPQWCKQKSVLAFLLRFKTPTAARHSSTMQYAPDDQTERHIAVDAFPLFSPRDRNVVFGTLVVFRDVSAEHLARQAGAEFVSHISHELKTPLQTLAAYSELLLDRTNLPEADQIDAINVIQSEVHRMSGLISNLLNISKMDSGTLKLNRKRVKLHELMQDAFAALRNSALGRDIALELSIPPDLGALRLDKDMFRIAVDNLLSNAIKYSNAGGKVTVSATMLDTGQIQIRVRDQGIGIAKEDADKVFAKYYRVASDDTASRSGHGLGLFLAKQIIELHQGSITLHSELGQGSEFIITFQAQLMQLEESEAV